TLGNSFVFPERVEPRSLARRQVLVDAIALIDDGLGFAQQHRRVFGPRLREEAIAVFLIDKAFNGDPGPCAVEAEGIHVGPAHRWIEMEQRPIPAGDRPMLLLHPVAYVVAMCDTVTVSQDQRRAVISLGVAHSLDRLLGIAAQRDL